LTLLCRPRFQTRSSARRTTPRSIPPRTCPIAALRAWKTSMPRFSPLTPPLLRTRRAPRPRASSRTLLALCGRRGRRRRRPLPRLAGGEAYRLHEEEAGYPRVVARREGQEEAGLRGEPQEGEEEKFDSIMEFALSPTIRGTRRSKICRCGRKQYTTDSLLLSN
jgi:hypothetical protein